jgi:hypothetical protein
VCKLHRTLLGAWTSTRCAGRRIGSCGEQWPINNRAWVFEDAITPPYSAERMKMLLMSQVLNASRPRLNTGAYFINVAEQPLNIVFG